MWYIFEFKECTSDLIRETSSSQYSIQYIKSSNQVCKHIYIITDIYTRVYILEYSRVLHRSRVLHMYIIPCRSRVLHMFRLLHRSRVLHMSRIILSSTVLHRSRVLSRSRVLFRDWPFAVRCLTVYYIVHLIIELLFYIW